MGRNEGIPSTLSGSCIRSAGLSQLDHRAGLMGHRLETMYRITADRQFEACPGMHVGNMFMTHVSADSVGSANRKTQGRRVASNMPSIHAFWSSAMDVYCAFGRRQRRWSDKLSKIQRERRIGRKRVIIKNYKPTSVASTIPSY